MKNYFFISHYFPEKEKIKDKKEGDKKVQKKEKSYEKRRKT